MKITPHRTTYYHAVLRETITVFLGSHNPALVYPMGLTGWAEPPLLSKKWGLWTFKPHGEDHAILVAEGGLLIGDEVKGTE